MNLQCNTCSRAISYFFSSTLINYIKVSCIFDFLEIFYNILKANKYTLDVCIILYKNQLITQKSKHKNMHALKRRHCIVFLLFTFKKKTLHCPSRKSALLVVCRNMSSIKSRCKRLTPMVTSFSTNPSN